MTSVIEDVVSVREEVIEDAFIMKNYSQGLNSNARVAVSMLDGVVMSVFSWSLRLVLGGVLKLQICGRIVLMCV